MWSTCAEGNVWIWVAGNIKSIGVLKDVFVAISRAVEHDNPFASLYGLSTDDGVLHRGALEMGHGTAVAQHFFDC